MQLNKYIKILFILSSLALIVRIILTPYGTFGFDLDTFQNWSKVLIRYQFDEFYNISKSDYLPGYNYFLWFLGKFIYLFNPMFLYKLPAIFADLGNAIFIYLLAKKFTTNRKALFSSLIFLFNPAVLINSTFWGQIDSVVTLFLLAGLYFLVQNKYLLSALLLGFCQSIKPIPLIVLPIFMVYIWYKSKSIFKLLNFIAIFIIATLIFFYPFNNQNNFIEFFININSMVADRWPYATINAFNLWIITSIHEDGNLQRTSDQIKFLFLSLQQWGYMLFGLIYLYVLLNIKKGIKLGKNLSLLLITAMSIIYLSMFIFFTRMHERHIFYTFPFITLLLPIIEKKGIFIFLIFFLASTFNVFFSLRLVSNNPIILQPFVIFLLFSINLITLFYLGETIRKAKAPLDK